VTDLLARTAQLVDIPSVSHNEEVITDLIEAELRAVPWLTVDRVAHTVVARTSFGREQRLILAGHTDTVPPNGNERARLDGDVLWGLGSADMKSGVAVLLELATTMDAPAMDVTYIFYECEEVASEYSGLLKLEAERPDLLVGDAAVLAEPTGARVEAGCQGTLRIAVTMMGERAHTARPWMGRNAIHRLGAVLDLVAAYEERRPVLNGCEFREALQAVKVEGGVAGNVVPDRATVYLNHRFAPDRTAEEATEHVRSVVAPALEAGDRFELLDSARPAPPALDHPIFARLVARVDGQPMAKLGWTDAAFFAARGTPATNFGPGDPNVAHNAAERVERHEIERVHAALAALLS
jgi:succinyl-diaminopimelate desuccinylase